MASLLERQREQDERYTRSNIGELIEGVVNRAVHTFDEAGPEGNGMHDDRHPKASMNPYESYNDTAESRSGRDKGKGKQKDRKLDKDPFGGQKIWLHCSVGEPGSLEQETEAEVEQRQQQVCAVVIWAPMLAFYYPDLRIFTRQRKQRRFRALTGSAKLASQTKRLLVCGLNSTLTGPVILLLQAVCIIPIVLLASDADETPLDEDEHARALEEQWMDNLGTGGGDMTGRKLCPGSSSSSHWTQFLFCFDSLQ